MDQLTKKISLKVIFKEFSNRYPKEFFFLFILLLIEGLTAALSMFAIIPIADFLLDQSLLRPSRITVFVINSYKMIDIPITFWSIGALFIFLNLHARAQRK